MSTQKLNTKEFSHEKLNGIVYTPPWIVRLILDKVGYRDNENILDKKIIDNSCGEGAFLTEAVERLINHTIAKKTSNNEIKTILENNIYGWDIDKNALSICKNNLDKVAKKYDIIGVEWQLKNGDSLNKSFSKDYFGVFDFVVGNPPYIRVQNMEKTKRKYIQQNWRLCEKGSTDIFIAFFQLGYKLLNRNGILGYITPNTYLKTSAGKSLRLFIKTKQSLHTLIDFGHHQVFDNATTYSLISILTKKLRESFDLYKGNARKEIEFVDTIKIKNLQDNNWILTSNDVLLRVKEIENRHPLLGEIAKIHVGVTTLADNHYIFKDPIFKNDIAIIKTIDGKEFEIEKNILKPIIKASILKSPDDKQNRFIIFPYKKIEGRNGIIPEDELKETYPLTYKYFVAIKDILLSRDKGKPNSVSWYAFGRSQGLDTSFGKKILTSGINLKPNFIVWEKEEYTFYAGYCIKHNGDLYKLAKELNSGDMEFYINNVSRSYQNNYKSYSKSFIQNFGINSHKFAEEKSTTSLKAWL